MRVSYPHIDIQLEVNMHRKALYKIPNSSWPCKYGFTLFFVQQSFKHLLEVLVSFNETSACVSY